MNFIWVWSAKNLKRYLVIVLAAFFTAGILYVERSQLPVISTEEGQPAAIYKVETEEKNIALTFNISWGEEKIHPILDILDEHNIEEASFFISAAWAERHPDLVERIVDDGHEIGSHGFRHEHYTEWEEDSIRRDIQTAHRIIEEVSQETPKYLRPPNGSFDERVLNIADQLNYEVIHWSINSEDWLTPGVDAIVNNVVNDASPGDIVLFHASDSAKQTPEALPKIIESLQSDGFSFVSVNELLEGTNTKNEEIQ